VEIDLKTVSIDWYFGTEAEGFTLKIETADLSKAREVLLLRERIDFDLGIGELTATQQSHLRLIATTPKNNVTAHQYRYPKPMLRKILSETQLMEIKKNGQHSPGNPPPKAPEKTILGKEVQAVSPKPPLEGGKDAWKEVGKNTKKKNKTPTASPSTIHDGEESSLNAFGVLGDQEGDDMEENSSSEGKSEKEEKEEVKVPSPKKKSQKRIEAEAELREKNAPGKVQVTA